MRKQIIESNIGIVDLDPSDNNHSITRKGYAHHSGTEFTKEWIGEFGGWVSDFVKDGIVVELGCGSGVISNYCTNYIGLDANPTAGNECVGEFFAVDLTSEYDFNPPIEADILLSFDFLEHIEEERLYGLLYYADRLLKPRAKIFLAIDTTPQETGEHVTLKPYEWWEEKLQKVWIRDELSNILKNSYLNSLPIHWKKWGAGQSQMLFLYHKGGDNEFMEI